ncbi:hypothetical protein DD829_16395 [Chryseobacterium sp. HMWF035]|nr:hypothetical protein DD829_16395 [Chryseobacterium sp. HMWF035]
MLMYDLKGYNYGKRALLFSFLFFITSVESQVFIRNSDYKIFTSVTVKHQDKNIEINKVNFKNISFDPDDKVVYNNKLLDFSVSQDTLFFFDRVKEIEEVHVSYNENVDRKEKTIKSSELKRSSASIFPNNLNATFIKIEVSRKTFVKSIIFFPNLISFPHDIKGNIDIQILPNINGFPDIDNPIMSFQRDISETVNKKWEIVLPKIMKYPDNGFFVTFYYLSSDTSKTALLKMNKDTYMYSYYPQYKAWKKSNINGYFYKLKVLQ